MTPGVSHLHTYFFFPFSIDKEAVLEDHAELRARHQHWIDALDDWIAAHPQKGTNPLVDFVGPWQRAAYTHFDVDAAAYQDMVFFHPFVRRVFFDTLGPNATGSESLLRCYSITPAETQKLWFEAEDLRGRGARVEVTDLRLFLFANGIGILSIGVEAFSLAGAEALWINEMMRKVCPSSGRQVREGRMPSRLAFLLEQGGTSRVLVEERFEQGCMTGFQPPLASTIASLLYFADYRRLEFEPVLDERMIVYTYAAIDKAQVTDEYPRGEAYQQFLSRVLYVDRDGDGYRYDADFTRTQMAQQLYRRWAHEGTYYGFTSYSGITATIGSFDCNEHLLREGFLIHRMFCTRYYLMAMVALFYRATLLDYAERTALVSKRLYRDQEDGKYSLENIRSANQLRAEFLHFSNYWYFDELANKVEEIEHFIMQCREYRVGSMKHEIEEEIEKLNAWLDNYYQYRNTEAVNRLAMLSLIVGCGAVLTGFFGMNFGAEFERVFFQPDHASRPAYVTAIAAVTLFAFGALLFGFFVIASNWSDYRDSLIPKRWNRDTGKTGSLKR